MAILERVVGGSVIKDQFGDGLIPLPGLGGEIKVIHLRGGVVAVNLVHSCLFKPHEVKFFSGR